MDIDEYPDLLRVTEAARVLWNPDSEPWGKVAGIEMLLVLPCVGFVGWCIRNRSIGCYLSRQGVRVRGFWSTRTLSWPSIGVALRAAGSPAQEWLVVTDLSSGTAIRLPWASRPPDFANRRPPSTGLKDYWVSLDEASATLRRIAHQAS